MLVRQRAVPPQTPQSTVIMPSFGGLRTLDRDGRPVLQSTTEPRRTVHDAVLRGSQIVAKGSFVKMDLCLWLCQPGLCGTEFGV